MKSWVDPLSNTVVLPNSLVEDHLAELMEAVIPPQFLTSFAHEFCHHWCFASGVGAAAAVTFMRAARESLRPGGNPHLATDLAARYEAVDRLLRPLMEGLALFTEFDVRCGKAPAASVPLSWTALAALPTLDDLGPGHPFDIAARRMRDPKLALPRKETLLTTPCDPEKSPYLVGYLAVKATWLSRLRASDREESDAFLMLVFVHLLGDYELILAICSTDVSTADAIGLMARRVDEVMAALADPTVTPQDRLWDEPAHDDDPAAMVRLPKLLGMDDQLHQKARDAIRAAVAEVSAAGSDAAAQLGLAFEIAVYRRQFVTTGHTEILIVREGGGVVLRTAGGYDVELVDTSWLDEAASGPATLELLLCPPAKAAVIAVFQNGGVAGFRSVQQGDGRILSSFADYAVSTRVAAEMSGCFTAAVRQATVEICPTVRTALGDAYRRVVASMDRPVALLVGETVLAQLRKDGYWTLCGRRLDRLRSVAVATLDPSPVVSPAEYATLFACCGDRPPDLPPRGPGIFIRGQVAILA